MKETQIKQKPVAWMDADGNVSDNNDYGVFSIPLYTTPPQRTEQEQQIETLKRCLFQMQEAAKDLVKQEKSLPSTQRKPLTDEEIGAILEGVNAYGTRLYTFARAIEAAHGIKE